MIGLNTIGSRLRRGWWREHVEDEAALRASYAAHGAALFRLALRALGDRGLAEEIVQDTYVRAWKSRKRFDAARGSQRTWLFSIARNLIIDAARARAARPLAGGQITDERDRERDHVTTEDPTERVLLSMQVEEALSRISDNHREVIVEICYRGRPYAEVAEELGVSAGTLRSRMYYGLKSLRLALEEAGYSDE
jgi:RNA polymerase sigma-70 factor (ECF subfamily)